MKIEYRKQVEEAIEREGEAEVSRQRNRAASSLSTAIDELRECRQRLTRLGVNGTRLGEAIEIMEDEDSALW